ncbi:MAG TPA: NAD(P)/FAD-dependent oxidoreductase [Gemmatimonadales bacterium]|jgi:cation diffusion facilitator CzcD-associated flavoprotein CzcO
MKCGRLSRRAIAHKGVEEVILGAVHCHTVIVGAGPAGLAVGACLKRAGSPYLILERSTQVASAWRRHYRRLHLHTDKAHSELPYSGYPRDYPRYPSRLQVIEYLEAYARDLELEIRFGQEVGAAQRANGHWDVHTQDSLYQTPNLVIAAGYNRVPYLPTWPEQSSFRGGLLHSSQYEDGEPFRNQDVLVVGFGNSGGEIAMDLHEHGARPSLAVRGPVNVIPRELLGIPILSIAILQQKLPPRLADALNAPILRAVIGDLSRFGLRTSAQGPMTQVHRDAHIPLIDVGTIGLIKQGRITVCPGIERLTDDGVTFTDGSHRHFDAVILATGYRPRVDAFLGDASAALGAEGTPASSGCESRVPGLYFCGYRVSATGMFREIALEARRIGDHIARGMRALQRR